MRGIIFVGISLVLFGVILLVVGLDGPWREPWVSLLTHLGSVSIGAGVVELIIQHVARGELVRQITDEVLKRLNLPIREFYENRKASVPRQEDLTGRCSELWIAWHTGSRGQTSKIFPEKCKGRAIFPRPSDANLEPLRRLVDGNLDLLRDNILHNTRTFLDRVEHQVEVRWFDGHIGNSLTVGDPQGSQGWVFVEVLLPKKLANLRPSFLVEMHDNVELFRTLVEAFEKLWEDAKPPKSFPEWKE